VVELHHAVPLRVRNRVGEDSSAGLMRSGIMERLRKVVAVEDVIAQNQAATFAGEKLFANQKRLCQTIWRRLNGILNLDSPLLAGT
jgi:hypothetical protein